MQNIILYSPFNCCLCHTRFKESMPQYGVSDTAVSTSHKSLKSILLHLSKVIKTPISLPDECRVCPSCFDELESYDLAMITLMKAQKKLTLILEKSLSEEIPLEIKDEEEDMIETDNHSFTGECSTEAEHVDVDSNLEMENEDQQSQSSDNPPENEIGDKFKVLTCEEPNCNRRFYSINSFNKHKQQHDYRPFVCQICGERKINEEYLELHMNLHEGKTEYECRYCPKKYARRTNVVRHMQLHWDKKKFQCEKCGERFSQGNILYNHKLLHEGEEKPLVCDTCGQVFKTRKTLKGHLRTHRPDRPRFECELCGKSFTERYTLKMHFKMHADGYIEEKRRKSPTNEFVCVICNLSCNAMQKLETHMSESHDVILREETIIGIENF